MLYFLSLAHVKEFKGIQTRRDVGAVGYSEIMYIMMRVKFSNPTEPVWELQFSLREKPWNRTYIGCMMIQGLILF